MANIYFFKATVLDDDESMQYGGIIAANDFTEAAAIIQRNNTIPDGKCELISIDYLEECNDSLHCYDLEDFARVYKEWI